MLKVVKLNNQQVYDLQLEKLNKKLARLSAEVGQSPMTIDEVMKNLLVNRQFKRSVPLPPVDYEEAVFVKVTHFEEQIDRQVFVFVVPSEYAEDAEAYKEHLQKSYDDTNAAEIPFSELEKFRDHLIVAKINGRWCRSRILNFVPSIQTVSLEDIDTGSKAIHTSPPDVFKMPKLEEMTKLAFASKVMVENMTEDDEIITGHFIKIRMTHRDPFGVNFAEAEDEELTEEFTSQDFVETRELEHAPAELIKPPAELIESAVSATAIRPDSPAVRTEAPPAESQHQDESLLDQTCDLADESWVSLDQSKASVASSAAKHNYRRKNNRHVSEVNFAKNINIAKHIEMKPLAYGRQINLFFISGNELDKGRMDVSGVPADQWVFAEGQDFIRMEEAIDKYVDGEPEIEYKPQLHELCLAKFEDRRFHRAICTNLKLSSATMKAIDYGFVADVDFHNVVKSTVQFAFPCFVHTVNFTLASGLPVSTIDVTKTREMLSQNRNITAQVMNDQSQPGKYKIILYDKFVVF